MILERFSHFANDFDIGESAGGAVVTLTTNILDLGKADPGDFGAGGPIYFVAMVGSEDVAGNGIKVRLVTDNDANLGSPNIVLQGQYFNASDATSGTVLMSVQLPEEGTPYLQYLGAQIEVASGTNLTAGKVHAFLTRQRPKHVSYADGAPALA